MPTTERIIQNNQAENQKAREYLKQHPDAVLGHINWHSEHNKRTKKLKDAIPLENFSYDFAIPRQDKELAKLILDYNHKPWTPSLIKDIDKIFTRIDALNGIKFYWI